MNSQSMCLTSETCEVEIQLPEQQAQSTQSKSCIVAGS